MKKHKFIDYRKYINSATWDRRRKRAIEDANNRCQLCGTADRVQVHHLSYDNLGNERQEDLLVVCRECHRLVHVKGVNNDN